MGQALGLKVDGNIKFDFEAWWKVFLRRSELATPSVRIMLGTGQKSWIFLKKREAWNFHEQRK